MTSTSPHMVKKPKTLPFILLGLAILVVTIVIVISWKNQTKPESPHTDIKNIPFVELSPVTTGDNKAVFKSGGFISAKYESKIAAKVNGTVLSLSPDFEVGNEFKQGEVLAYIDKTNYLAAVANAKANLASSKSNYAQEQARARQAKRDAKRLSIKTSDLLLRKPQLAAAKAMIDNANAQLKLAQKNLDETTIKAPFDAIIYSRNISQGDSVNANTIVAQLVSTKTFVVKLSLDRALFNLTSIGDKVILTNPSTGMTYNASLVRFSPALNESSRTASVYAEIENPLSSGKPLLINSYLLANIEGKNLPNTIWINNSDTIQSQYVWIKKNDNTLAKSYFTLFHRGPKKSLVRFNNKISHFVIQPKDSFFEGETVTTEAPTSKKSQDNKNSTKQGES